MGLRLSSPEEPGWTRRRAGRGFSWRDVDGHRLGPADRDRAVSLVIPPAWEDVWVCADPDGHLQAVGTDAAGRRQYIYHPEWRAQRDAEKYDRSLAFGEALGRTRGVVNKHLADAEVTARRACAVAFRLLDRGSFRIGSDVYADENGSFGLTTLRPEHVRLSKGVLTFDFVGKSEVVHHIEVDDPDVIDAICTMRRRRSAKGTLLAFRELSGWRQLAPEAVNDYIREVTRLDVTAKDFRTWHGGIIAAATLSAIGCSDTEKEQDAAIRTAVQAAADLLGNTPALARSAYVDPRILERYREGRTVPRAVARRALEDVSRLRPLELALIRLIRDE